MNNRSVIIECVVSLKTIKLVAPKLTKKKNTYRKQNFNENRILNMLEILEKSRFDKWFQINLHIKVTLFEYVCVNSRKLHLKTEGESDGFGVFK